MSLLSQSRPRFPRELFDLPEFEGLEHNDWHYQQRKKLYRFTTKW